jgi:hypothetical protein
MRTELSGQTAQQVGPIQQALLRVQSKAEAVVSLLNLLNDRLAPVLRQQAKPTGVVAHDGKTPVPPESQATQEINRSHEILIIAEHILDNILMRLEL